LEKSHIHFLESVSLITESRVTESAQFNPSWLRRVDLYLPVVKTFLLLVLRIVLQEVGILLGGGVW